MERAARLQKSNKKKKRTELNERDDVEQSEEMGRRGGVVEIRIWLQGAAPVTRTGEKERGREEPLFLSALPLKVKNLEEKEKKKIFETTSVAC